MSGLSEKLYAVAPHALQNLAVTLFNVQYLKRCGGVYPEKKKLHDRLYRAPLEEQLSIQRERFLELVAHAHRHSPYYRNLWKGIDLSGIRTVEDIRVLPVVTKEDIRKNFPDIATLDKKHAYVAHTGGTTGKSLEIFYTWPDFQERQGVLDSFRERYGWHLGKKTAWFSGKNLLSQRDVEKHRFWKTDLMYHIRYYSTFHLSSENIPYYLEDLNRFAPEFFSGFASNMYELAQYAKRNGFKVTCSPKAIFTTAETLVPEQTRVIEEVFHSRVYDQYSSSEGAPFIIQCEAGAYHFLPATGIIEIVDEKGNPAVEGEALITYFHSHGTPLVRYRIRDRMKWGENAGKCECGSYCPVVQQIQGREMDFLYSRERGKINLGNVSNCVKYTPGIVKFQAIQSDPDRIRVDIVADSTHNETEREQFLKELRARLGEQVGIELAYVADIGREPSGKFRIVKNTIPTSDI